MEKLKYQKIENYEAKRQNVLSAFAKNVGGAPKGLQFELVMPAFIKIYEFFNEKYKGVVIQAKDIPDVNEFAVKRESYTVGQLIINRIAKNVKEIDFKSGFDEKNKSMAAYFPKSKKINIYNTNIDNGIEELFKNMRNVEFESDEDFRRIMLEQTLIHELLHAISDTGLSWGLQEIDSKKGVTLNEGITESISLEIAGLKNVFNKGIWTGPQSGKRFGTRGQSGTYLIESNIANFVRLASKEDFTLGYIVDGKNIKFGALDKIQIYKDSNPLGMIAQTMDEYVLGEWTDKTFDKVQELQSMLIEDILENKLTKQALRQTSMTQEQYNDLVEDVLLIGNCVIPTLPSQEKTEQIKQSDLASKGYVEKIDFAGTAEKIRRQLSEGRLEETENVKKYAELLGEVEHIGQKFGLEREIE